MRILSWRMWPAQREDSSFGGAGCWLTKCWEESGPCSRGHFRDKNMIQEQKASWSCQSTRLLSGIPAAWLDWYLPCVSASLSHCYLSLPSFWECPYLLSYSLCPSQIHIKLIFTGAVAFKGPNVNWGLYKCDYSLTRGQELSAAAE